jgi:hypothetical protein
VGSKLMKYISRRFGIHQQPKAPVLIATDGCDKKMLPEVAIDLASHWIPDIAHKSAHTRTLIPRKDG